MAPPAQCPTSSPLGFVWESVVPPSLPFPHHFATFLCYAWRGFLFPPSLFFIVPSFLTAHTHPRLPCPLQASKMGSPAPGASGECEGHMQHGPMSHPLLPGYGPGLHLLLWSPSSMGLPFTLGFSHAGPPVHWRLSTPNLCPLHSTYLECHSSLGHLVTTSLPFIGSVRHRETHKGSGANPASEV